MKRTSYFAIAMLATLPGQAAGQTVIVNDNLTFEQSGGSLGDYTGTIQQTTSGDITSAWFDYDLVGGTLTGLNMNIDEGSDWYVVDPFEVFGFATLAEDRFTPIIRVASDGGDIEKMTVPVQSDLFLGVATTGQGLSHPCEPGTTFCRNVFGWIHLRPSFPGLEVVSSAVAYDSLGIVVATSTVIPEPACVLLAAVALCTVCSAAARRR